jgi:hypothetical protein
VAPRCIGAPREHAQHPRRRVLSVASPGILTGADIKGDVGATRAGSMTMNQLSAFKASKSNCLQCWLATAYGVLPSF